MLSLLPHQQRCHDAVIRSYIDEEPIISFQMATGSGKTRVLLVLPSSMKHTRNVYVFPTLGLIRQFKDDYLDEFTHIFPQYVEASSNSSLTDSDLKKVLSRKTFCIITTYDSLPKVLQYAKSVDCVLFDEAHHADAPECHKSMTDHKAKIKCVIRASATLNESDTPCFTYPFHQAVKDGVCRDYSTYCFIKKKGSEHELISYLEEHRKQTGNSKVMVFTTFTEAEKEGTTNVYQFMDQYRESVAQLGGWMNGIVSLQPQDERQAILKTFESNDENQLSLLVSCRTIGEGVDTKKANIVLFVDPIRSTIMIIQRIGRGTRVYRDEKGVSLAEQRDGSVIVGIYIDPAKYEGKTEEEIDQLLKENMSKDGDFSAIFCVLAALRETDPDTYYQCIHFLDRQKVNARIQEQGMDRIEVPRDGNCFFHCIGLQTGETHEQVRQQVVDYMEEHSENYEEFLSDKDSVEALRKEGEWNNDAMDVVVQAAADMLGQTIRVHRPDGRIDEVGEGKEQIDVLLEDNHYTFIIHQDKVYNEEVEEKRSKVKSLPKKKLFIDIDPDFKILWKVKGDLVNDFTARIEAEIENDGLTMVDRWIIKLEELTKFIEKNKDVSKITYKKDDKLWISKNQYNFKHNHSIMKNVNINKKWVDFCKKYNLDDDIFDEKFKLWKKSFDKLYTIIKETGIYPCVNDDFALMDLDKRIKRPLLEKYKKNMGLLEELVKCNHIMKSGKNKGKICGEFIGNNCKYKFSDKSFYTTREGSIHFKKYRGCDSHFITDPFKCIKHSKNQNNIDLKKNKIIDPTVHFACEKNVKKPMTHILPQPSLSNPPSEQPYPSCPRPQSQLSLLHKEYKTLRSDNLGAKFREHPQLWHEYHQIAEANEASFPDGQIPYQRVIAFLNAHLATFHPKKQKTIVDMGCGTARVQQAFADRPNLIFYNLDHVACNDQVMVADIAHTGLEDGDADVAILCLAMWGSNKEEYLTEAYRLLDPNGRLIIVEPSKRWMDESGQHLLGKMLEQHGFTIVQEEVMVAEQIQKFSLFVVRK